MRGPASGDDFAFVLYRNGLVLALHALACVAGFIAGSSLPIGAEGYSGAWRRSTTAPARWRSASSIAATLFSLCTQAYALGRGTADLAGELGVSPPCCCSACSRTRCRSCRAVPPARGVDARRSRRAWDELLAATFVTVAIAVPILIAAAAVETWVSPDLASYTF